MITFDGVRQQDPGAREARRKLGGGVAGHVLFRRQNVTTLEQTQALIASLNKGLTAVEFTTGQIGDGPRPTYPPLLDVGRSNSPHDAHELYARMAAELASLGLDLNLAPVLGLEDNDCQASYGQNPLHAASFATAFVHGHRDAGVLTALNHCRLSMASSGLTDVAPVYAEVIKKGVADAVVVSGKSASDTIKVLKEQLGFQGLIIADFTTAGPDVSREAVKAAVAGADVILVKSGGASDPAWRLFKALLRAVKDGVLTKDRTRQIAQSIAAFEGKAKAKIVDQQTAQRVGTGVSPR